MLTRSSECELRLQKDSEDAPICNGCYRQIQPEEIYVARHGVPEFALCRGCVYLAWTSLDQADMGSNRRR